MASKIKCVIFDFGDTLINTSEASKKAMQKRPEVKVLKKHGFDFSKKQIQKAHKIMIEKTRHLSAMARKKDWLVFARTLLQELGIENPSKRLAKKCEKAYYSELRKNIKLMPRAREILEFLKKRKIKLFVVSNTRTDSHLKVAKKFNIRKYFRHFIMSHRFGSVKSELKIFQHALEKINKGRKNKIKPEECLMAGNNAEEDGAAKLVGMKVALLKPTLAKKKHLKTLKPDYLLNDLGEIKEILETS